MVVFSICALLYTQAAFSQQKMRNVPHSVQSAQDMANWLASEFEYRMEFSDSWQTPHDTIMSRTGDCEDFALLASALLHQMGRENDILILKFKGLKTAHAVCIWKDSNDSYNFFSNRELKRTGKNSLEEAIEKYYPDWEEIRFSKGKSQQYGKIIRRKYSRN